MLHVALVSAALLAALGGDASPSSEDLKTYQALKLKAGADPQAQVKLALWCEAHGMDAERLEHLARAAQADPNNATARGLMGLIHHDGRWESADRIGERVKADFERSARLAEYRGRRTALADKEWDLRATVDRLKEKAPPQRSYAAQVKGDRGLALAHANLGTWCEQKGLKPEAIAHFTTAVHLDPSRESSWRRLGYVKRNGRWTSFEQAAAEEKEERAQRLANRHWEPLLAKWKSWLFGSPSYREQAESHLAAVTDPHAVPAILKVFPIGGTEAEQSRLVSMLAKIDDPRSSRALAELAVKTRSVPVRTAAMEVLVKRPPRDYVGELVDKIRGKVRYSIQPVAAPGSTGCLVLENRRVRLVMTYKAPPAFQLGSTFHGYAGYDANGLPVVIPGVELDRLSRVQIPILFEQKVREVEARTAAMFAEANIKAEAVQQRMNAEVNQVETMNAQAEADNAQVIPVLQVMADAPSDLKDDEEAWRAWWYDKLGYSYQSAPQVTIVQDATPPQLPPPTITTCFVAGTPVHTLDGPRPIESIQVGDQVLGQDAATGALAFQPVVFLHHNPPGKTLRVALAGGDAVTCSVYHRFWRANVGWAMARELQPGDVLRTLGGLARVASVEPGEAQPLYNLDVAGSRTFFAGAGRLLVHDNTLPDHRLRPFDALPVVGGGRSSGTTREGFHGLTALPVNR